MIRNDSSSFLFSNSRRKFKMTTKNKKLFTAYLVKITAQIAFERDRN